MNLRYVRMPKCTVEVYFAHELDDGIDPISPFDGGWKPSWAMVSLYAPRETPSRDMDVAVMGAARPGAREADVIGPIHPLAPG